LKFPIKAFRFSTVAHWAPHPGNSSKLGRSAGGGGTQHPIELKSEKSKRR
jgi:hypothetical protein